MARLLRSLQRLLGNSSPAVSIPPPSPSATRLRSIDTDFSIIKEGDQVLLHTKQPTLTKPLKKGGKTSLRRGHLEHDRAIGSRVWDAVQAHKGPDVRLSLPTLEEYVTLTPRLVTPIYAHDANLIVSLLDIHTNPTAANDTQPPIEILESGTGHGSLTLHLARALHAANTTPPPRPAGSQIQYVAGRNRSPTEKATPETEPEVSTATDPSQKEWDEWRTERGAIIHTVDVSSKFAKLAEKNVLGFRRGIYSGTVDFYVGAVEEWIKSQVAQRTKPAEPVKPFLTYAILDMPSAHERIPLVKDIIHRDGKLIVFAPSITQIGDCVRMIQKMNRPFVLDRVVELGSGLTSGRNWDVRLAVKKSGSDPSTWESATEGEEAVPAEDEASDSEPIASVEPAAPSAAFDESNAVMVCRPKVGLRTMGGGFVGVWRRIEDHP